MHSIDKQDKFLGGNLFDRPIVSGYGERKDVLMVIIGERPSSAASVGDR